MPTVYCDGAMDVDGQSISLTDAFWVTNEKHICRNAGLSMRDFQCISAFLIKTKKERYSPMSSQRSGGPKNNHSFYVGRNGRMGKVIQLLLFHPSCRDSINSSDSEGDFLARAGNVLKWDRGQLPTNLSHLGHVFHLSAALVHLQHAA